MNNKGNFSYLLNRELADNERIFKLSSAILNAEGTLNVRLLVDADKHDEYLIKDDYLRNKVENILRKIVPEEYGLSLTFEKTFSTEEYAVRLLRNFIYNEYPLVFNKIKDIDFTAVIDDDKIYIKSVLPAYLAGFLSTDDVNSKIINHLDSKLMESVEITYISDNVTVADTITKRKEPRIIEELRLITVRLTDKICGTVSRPPKYISDISAESENMTLSGKISDLSERENKKNNKKFYTFKIDDTTGKMDVKFFPRERKEDEKDAKARERSEKQRENYLEKLKDDAEICIEGPLRMDMYTGNYCLMMYKASLCEIDYGSIVREVKCLECPEDYRTVIPVPYIHEEQMNMFGGMKRVNPSLSGKTFVVFDFETTGLSSEDKIIEIGAVKIVNGVMTETFETFIDPEINIPRQASEKNHIYDSDVAGCPLWTDVVGDFFRFTQNATLVAHNANFDKGFLDRQSKPCRYIFNNAVIDTMALAREKNRARRLSLEALCKEYNIQNEDAHRALSDAVATAKLFLILA